MIKHPVNQSNVAFVKKHHFEIMIDAFNVGNDIIRFSITISTSKNFLQDDCVQ